MSLTKSSGVPGVPAGEPRAYGTFGARRRAARTHDGGFSFVELLVTIILAAIVFAAMVPVFVNAQKATGGDKVRNAALNLAQDRIEKIRQLTFAQACDENAIITELGSYHQSGGRKFSIAYSSEPESGSTPTYTRIEVTVSWTAPPSPVRPVTVSTIVANNEVATVAAPTPSGSASPSPTPSATISPSPSPSPSATTYPVQNFSLTLATNEWYGHKARLYQTDVTPVLDKGTKEFNGNTAAVWSNIPSGAYRIEHTYGWWDFVTEVSTVHLTSNLTVRYDNYNSLYPGH